MQQGIAVTFTILFQSMRLKELIKVNGGADLALHFLPPLHPKIFL